jgi:hypothetical protein
VKRGFKSWAEKQAEHWRREVSLQPWQLLPSETLAERLKVKFICPRTIDGFPTDLRDLLLGPRATEWSAAAFAVNAHYVVVENTTHSIERREATRMHEMAHIICGHKPTGFSDAGELGVLIRGHDQDQEDEADCLGRCLHLPKPVLGWCLNRGYTHEQISTHCKASMELVRLRLNTSGVLHIRRRMQGR